MSDASPPSDLTKLEGLQVDQSDNRSRLPSPEIKRAIGGHLSNWIDATLDHKMLLHKDDPVLPLLRQQGEPVHVMDVNPTAENIARLIYDFIAAQGFPVVEVRLWETETCFASYSARP